MRAVSASASRRGRCAAPHSSSTQHSISRPLATATASAGRRHRQHRHHQALRHHHHQQPLNTTTMQQSAAAPAATARRQAVVCSAGAAEGGAGTATASKHLILAPPASNTAAPESECLLVFAPGAGLGPADFKHLAEAAQANAPHVRLWAACMHLDYAQVGAVFAQKGAPLDKEKQAKTDLSPVEAYLEQLLSEVRQEATAAGFKARVSGFGRCTNLYLCAQSAAGVTLSSLAFKAAAGFILLASTFDGRYATGQLPSLEDYGRPVLILGGELDGQLRWPWQAALAADAAVLAQKAGPCYAAAHQPFILVPGANHAQTSNGVPNYARGDIPPTTEYATATEHLSKAVASFVTSHQAAEKSDRQAAADDLLVMVRQTAEMLAPYFMASGMGDICAAWVTGRSGGPESTASLDIPDTSHPHQQPTSPNHPSSPLQQPLLQGARREVAQRVSGALHPGVVQKAERFVAAAQLKLASSLPREVMGRLRVVVHIHTDVEALLLNQPRVQEQPDSSVVVAVHALVGLPNVVRPGAKLPSCRPAAPEYWLKLKRPQAIADDLGLEGVFADGTTAAALNSSALQAALAAVAPGVVDRYHASGWQLAFDTDTSVPDINAEKFIREGAMKFTPQPSSSSSAAQQQQGGQDGSGGGSSGGRGTVQVASPVLTSRSVGEIRKMAAAAGKPDDPQSAAMLAAAADPYMVRFLGNWYTKVLSVAQAMEWVMLDSLREDVTWS